MITALLLLPPALAGCALGTGAQAEPDPLIALADAARSDVALAAAALASTPALGPRVQPLVDARTAHAQALDAEVARLDPRQQPSRPPAQTTARTATLAEVRAAVLASGRSAAAAALTLPPDRVGLVASVAACCAAYAQVLG